MSRPLAGPVGGTGEKVPDAGKRDPRDTGVGMGYIKSGTFNVSHGVVTMPKNTSADILRRWREMDLLLWQWELHIPKFAKKWGVSQKTVYRDIAAFKELGQRPQPQPWWGAGYADSRADAARRDEKFYDGGVLIWGYDRTKCKPLFRHPELLAKPPAPPAGGTPRSAGEKGGAGE